MIRLKQVSKICALLVIACALHVVCAAHAQDALNTTDEISKLYCNDGGKIARCIGYEPEQCVAIVRPLVEKCQRDVRDAGERERASAFANCFAFAYSGKYSHKVQHTKECITHIEDPGAVRPAPPEFAAKGTYHPPSKQ